MRTKRRLQALSVAAIAVAGIVVATGFLWRGRGEARPRGLDESPRGAEDARNEPGEVDAATPAATRDDERRSAAESRLDSGAVIPTRESAVPAHWRIRVTSSDADAIAGAAVLVLPSSAVPDEARTPEDETRALRALAAASARTGPDGTAVVERAGLASSLIVARADGYVPAFRWVAPADAAHEIAFELLQGESRRVLVLDGAGDRAVAGARIVATPFGALERPSADPASSLERLACTRWAVTDLEGRALLHGLRPQRTELLCVHDGFPRTRVYSDPGGGDIVIRLQQAMVLRGIVVDEERRPVPGAEVRPMLQGQFPTPFQQSARSDENGEFVLQEAPTGAMSIAVIKPGYALEKRRFDLDAAEPAMLEFVLRPQASFRGVAVDDLGVPLAGVHIEVYDEDLEGDLGECQTQSDGGWWMHRVGAGRRMVVMGSKEGHQWGEVDVIAGEATEVTVVLRRLAAVAGHVLDGDGRPIPSFSMRWAPLDLGSRHERESLSEEFESSFETSDGSFRLERIWPGSTVLHVDAPGFESWHAPIELGPGMVRELEIRLQSTGSLSGTVVTGDGRGVGGARVSLALSDDSGVVVGPRRRIAGVTDEAGSFILPTRPGRPFDLIIECDGFGRALHRELLASSFPRELVMAAPGAIAGLATCPWRSPDTVLRVRVAPAGTALCSEHPVDHRGAFRIEPLAPGDYVVELDDLWASTQLDGSCAMRTHVEVRSGETSEVELSSAATGVVTGRILARRGADPRCLRVLARGGAGDAGARAAILADCDADLVGKYALFGLPLGELEVGVNSTERGRQVSAWRRVVLSETTPRASVDLELPAGGLVGRVIADDRSPLDASVYVLREPDGEPCSEGRVDAAGGFEIVLVDAGIVRLLASAPGMADRVSGPIPVDPDRSGPEQEFVLEPESRLETRVVDDRGRPVPFAELVVELAQMPPSLRKRRVPLDAQAKGVITRLSEGKVRLTAHARGHVPWVGRLIDLARGETRLVEVVLQRSATLQVIVADPAAGPVADVEVTIATAGNDSSSRKSDPSGRARFTGLAPGDWSVRVGSGRPHTVALAPGEVRTLEIPWAPDVQ